MITNLCFAQRISTANWSGKICCPGGDSTMFLRKDDTYLRKAHVAYLRFI